MGVKFYLIFICSMIALVASAPVSQKMCYNLACPDYTAICYYLASEKADHIMETTMCLDSAENVLQRETKKRTNILGMEIPREHILPKNWIGSGDVPETAAAVVLRSDEEPEINVEAPQ